MMISALHLIAVFAQTITGQATVIDGDTLHISDERIRLHGIDAPESLQWCRDSDGGIWACGAASTSFLTELIDEQPVSCEVLDTDRYGRSIAECFAGGESLNERMVRSGYALAYRQYSQDYVEAEAAAAVDRVGMWSGSFIQPWRWRRGERDTFIASPRNEVSPTEQFQDRDCSDFSTWEAAQAFFLDAGDGDPHRLDGNGDGIACNALRNR